jgi:hypothetical protein
VKHYCLQSTNILIPFGIRKNRIVSGRSLLLYQFTRRMMKRGAIIIVRCHCHQLYTKFYRLSFVKVNSIHGYNYWGPSVWVLM